MAHKTDRRDVLDAVARYKALTGDVDALLCEDGPHRAIRGRYPDLDGFCKAEFVHVVNRFCDGFEAGREAERRARSPSTSGEP